MSLESLHVNWVISTYISPDFVRLVYVQWIQGMVLKFWSELSVICLYFII